MNDTPDGYEVAKMACATVAALIGLVVALWFLLRRLTGQS